LISNMNRKKFMINKKSLNLILTISALLSLIPTRTAQERQEKPNLLACKEESHVSSLRIPKDLQEIILEYVEEKKEKELIQIFYLSKFFDSHRLNCGIDPFDKHNLLINLTHMHDDNKRALTLSSPTTYTPRRSICNGYYYRQTVGETSTYYNASRHLPHDKPWTIHAISENRLWEATTISHPSKDPQISRVIIFNGSVLTEHDKEQIAINLYKNKTGYLKKILDEL